MADVSDVENVIVALLAQTLYPNGTSSPSVTGTVIRLPYRGWPVPEDLDADLKAGTVNVTVYPMGNETNVTKYQRKWYERPVATPALEARVLANTITVEGIPGSPLNVAAIINGAAYVYPVQSTDTLTSIATGLAALINVDIEASSSGAIITVDADALMRLSESGPLKRRFGGALLESMAGFWPSLSGDSPVPPPRMHISQSGTYGRRFGGALLGTMAGFWPVKAVNMALSGLGKRFGGAILPSMAAYWATPSVGITARVGGAGSVVREIKRQKRGFQISFWCMDDVTRDAISAACDQALAETDYLVLPDGTLGRLRYERTVISDKSENQGFYRRDLIYSVEYGTTQTMTAPIVLTNKFNLSGGLDPSESAIKTFFN